MDELPVADENYDDWNDIFDCRESCLSPYRQVAVFCDVTLATADHLVGDLHNEGGNPLRAEEEHLSIAVKRNRK